MSSAVMTVVDAPTMPANCRFVVTLLVCALLGGEPLGLLVCERFGATRRAPDPSSLMGLARVRFASEGGLTSIGGSWSGEACCALAAEIPRERTGTRKVEARRQMRRRFAALMLEDMVRPRYDVSGTSQRTKSHHWALRTSGEANVCTPRPTSSRVTTADGRSPGLRVVTPRRLPRTEMPSGL